MKKTIIIMIMLTILSSFSYAEDYYKITGDSVFVVGVDWQKQDTTDYTAYVTVDLNYVQYSNPLTRYAIAEQYNWNNWWVDYVNFGEQGTTGATINTSSGETYTYQQVYYYYELPDITPGSEADEYQCNVDGICGDIEPSTRVGYYGLPFYIQHLEFFCDDDDNNKGGVSLTPGLNDIDYVTLIRPHYEGLPELNVEFETATVPLGFGTRPGQIVRYNGIPVDCVNMDTTTNSRLSFTLRPNPLYRHVDPNIEGSETWSYGSIISLLPSVLNSENLPFNMNIDFNFTGDFWNYEIDTSQELQAFEDAYFDDANYDLICEVEDVFGNIEVLNFKELTTQQKLIINTGEGITCRYPESKAVSNINSKQYNDILEAISYQRQREVVLQLDSLESKFVTKKFLVRSIIPFFAVIVIIAFYIIQLILLGFVFLGLVPMMFHQFILGLKDAFSVEELIHEEKKKKGLVRRYR